MSFLRRNQGDKKEEQAVPAESTVPSPAVKKEEKSSGGGGGLFGGIRQYILDSYNGLYKIVLEPSMPTKQTVILLIVGLVIGLIWGYALQPTEFYGGNPNRLNESSQRLWIKSVAMATDPNQNFDPSTAQALLGAVPNPAAQVDAILAELTANPNASPQEVAALTNLKNTVLPSVTASAPKIEDPGLVSQLLSGWIVPILIIAIVTPILVVVWRLLIQPNIAAPLVDRVRRLVDKEYDRRRREEIERFRATKDQERERREMKEQMAREAATSDFGPPVKASVFIYSKGRSFDESVEIELATGEFLGQCGAVIAEAVDPDPTAIEVWLFDMTTQKQINKVFVTEQAYAVPSTKAALEDSVDNPATDIIVAAPGKKLLLETDGLRLQSEMATLEVAPDGRFAAFKMTVQAWQQKKAGAGAPLGAMPMPMPVAPVGAPPPLPPAKPLPSYDDLTFDPPPPAAPKPLTPPPLPPAKPLPSYDDLTFDPPPVAPRPLTPPPLPPAKPLPSYDDLTFDPPPAPPAPRPLTPLGGVSPLKPPAPPSAPGFDDDDPFGGTGDFTPLSSGN